MSVLNNIENKIEGLDTTDCFAAILGESPSKGAKSPILWNAVFNKLELSAYMYPMDIPPSHLGGVVAALKDDKRFIGGAVTMPYKIKIIPFLDDIETEAKTIGAVNCIYRNGDNLVGANTDGAGALWSVKNKTNNTIFNKTILLMGSGGAGSAVATYIAYEIGHQGVIGIANRDPMSRDRLVEKLKTITNVDPITKWPISSAQIGDGDIIINCTSVGFENVRQDDKGKYSLKFFTPLGPINDETRVHENENIEKHYLMAASKSIAENLKKSMEILVSLRNPLIFDIIYQPGQTMLLYLSSLIGYPTLNGAGMNLEQAVIAFDKATAAVKMRKSNCDEVRELMSKIS